VHCGGDLGLPDCAVQQWVVVGKTNSRVSYYQTDCSGGQATRDVAGKMVAPGVALGPFFVSNWSRPVKTGSTPSRSFLATG